MSLGGVTVFVIRVAVVSAFVVAEQADVHGGQEREDQGLDHPDK